MSLKGDKYETAEEIKFRLEGTVVLYDEKPVYINRVNVPENVDEKGEVARVFFRELPNIGAGARETRKYLSSKKFDLAPFRMGYFNHKGEAIFASRNPIRQNKQGLCAATLSVSDIKGDPHRGVNFGMLVAVQGFADMINGVFPDFKQIGDMIGDKETHSAAVSRSFAFYLDHDLESVYLMNKGVRCGIAMKGDKALKVPPKFHFLRQEMEQHRIPLA